MSVEFGPIRVLGMMSGTSIDGVDAAVVETDGEGFLRFHESGFEPYSDAERTLLRGALGKWPSQELKPVHDVVLDVHARLAKRFDVEVIGFHGQTLAHDPAAGRTHQLGDGATLAKMTSQKVVWDFRSEDMNAGGQGAPLAPFFHHALARLSGLSEPVAFLNLGGVANVTWVDPSVTKPEVDGALLAFDTGPANALIDDFVAKSTGQAYDKDGALASKGRIHQPVLDELSRVDYLNMAPPKSLDRDDFVQLVAHLEGMSPEDGAATLTEVTAVCIGRALPFLPSIPARWFACGGGRHNATMMRTISDNVGCAVEPVEALGFDGDMLEAQAFAWLAVRVMRGLPTSAPSTTGCKSPVSGGTISIV